MNVSERLKLLRQKNNLTQVELSKELGISRGYFSTLETNPDAVNDRIIKLYALHFAVREEWIKYGTLPIREPFVATYKGVFADAYFDLAAELLPTFDVPEVFCALLKNSLEYSRMFHYLSHRFMTSKDKNEPKRLSALFSVAFPDYVETADAILSSVSKEEKEARRSPPLAKQIPVQPVGKAAAGAPTFDNEANDTLVELPIRYLDSERYFSIEVQGDSMEPRLYSGDIVIVARNVLPLSGQLALIHTIDNTEDGGYLVKKVEFSNNSVRLISLNSAYPPVDMSRHDIADMHTVVYTVHR